MAGKDELAIIESHEAIGRFVNLASTQHQLDLRLIF